MVLPGARITVSGHQGQRNVSIVRAYLGNLCIWNAYNCFINFTHCLKSKVNDVTFLGKIILVPFRTESQFEWFINKNVKTCLKMTWKVESFATSSLDITRDRTMVAHVGRLPSDANWTLMRLPLWPSLLAQNKRNFFNLKIAYLNISQIVVGPRSRCQLTPGLSNGTVDWFQRFTKWSETRKRLRNK